MAKLARLPVTTKTAVKDRIGFAITVEAVAERALERSLCSANRILAKWDLHAR